MEQNPASYAPDLWLPPRTLSLLVTSWTSHESSEITHSPRPPLAACSQPANLGAHTFQSAYLLGDQNQLAISWVSLEPETANHQQLSQSSAALCTYTQRTALLKPTRILNPCSGYRMNQHIGNQLPEEHVPTATSVFLLGGAGGMPGNKRSARKALLVLWQLVAVSLWVSHESSETTDSILQLVARSSPLSKV